MKIQLITVLSIVGVLGTAGTAMAINTTMLSSAGPAIISSGIEVLVPVVEAASPEPRDTPSPASTEVKKESVSGSTETPHPESTETKVPEIKTPETPHSESTETKPPEIKTPDKKSDD